MKRKRRITALAAIVGLTCGTLALAQGKGKGGGNGGGGGGGGGNQDSFPATFYFSPCSAPGVPCITGDGLDYDGGFVPAGNPILDLRNSTRTVTIEWDQCRPGPEEGVIPESPQARLTPSSLWDEFQVLVDDRFLGMAVGPLYYSRLGVTFAPEEKKSREGWKITFNENDGAGRVQVERLSDTVWHVTSLYEDGTQALAKIGRVRNGAFRLIGLCPFEIDYLVTCDTCPPAPMP